MVYSKDNPHLTNQFCKDELCLNSLRNNYFNNFFYFTTVFYYLQSVFYYLPYAIS